MNIKYNNWNLITVKYNINYLSKMSYTVITQFMSQMKMSNQTTIDTKMCFGEESLKEPLFEGGNGEKAIPNPNNVDKVFPVGKEREQLIQWAYGMFVLQLLPQLVIVWQIANLIINCKVDDKNSETVIDQ